MDVLSTHRGARISAFKARELTREIQGKSASAALDLVRFSTKKAAILVGKTLKSAIANAANNNNLRVETLVVKEATVGEGPTMRRMKSRARGSSSLVRKRTSHIRIVLSDEAIMSGRRITIPQKCEPGRGSSLRDNSRILKRIDEQRSYPHKQDAITIQAIARFKDVDEENPTLRVGSKYILDVTVVTEPDKLIRIMPQKLSQGGIQIAYDVFVTADRNRVSIIPNSVQSIVISRGAIAPKEFYIEPLSPGNSSILVHYIYCGTLVAKLRLEVTAVSQTVSGFA